MTRFHRELRTCPKCLNEEEVVVWDVLDISADPDLKDRLLRRELHSFECANCGELLTNLAPLLYFDPESNVQIFCSPSVASLQNEGSLSEDLQTELREAIGTEHKGPRMRLVPDLNLLLEKIHLFDHYLDDRVMEILKIALKTHYAAEENMRLRNLYFLSSNSEIFLFQAETEEQGWYSLEMPAELYLNAEETLLDQQSELDDWAVIDTAWAMQWLEEHSH